MARQNKLSIKGLTPTQYEIIWDIVSRVQDIMKWDEDMQMYTDNGNFLYAITEEEHKELQAIIL